MICSGRRNIARPLRDGALKVSLTLERLDSPCEIRDSRTIESQQPEQNIPDLIRLIRWDSHVSRHLRTGLLRPCQVASEGHHDGTAGLPMDRLEFLHQFPQPEV